MKNKKKNQIVDTEISNDDESPSSCETRRRIEDMLERRRYKDELGDYNHLFDISMAEEV